MLRKLRRFEYLRPATVADAVTVLQDYQERASILAGGTDLLVFMKLGGKRPQYVVDVKGIAGLDTLSWTPAQGLRIGCVTTLQTILRSPVIAEHLPMLSQAMAAVGHPQIRRRGTIAGSICTASPSGDPAPSLLALNANIRVSNPRGERMLCVEEVFAGPFKTILEPTDVITEIQAPALPRHSGGSYRWLPKLTRIDETLVGAAAVVTLADGGRVVRDVRIGLGSVAPTPMRAREAEESLKGQPVSEAVFAQAGAIAAKESRPRTRAEYRRDMVQHLVAEALKEAADRASRNGGLN